MKSIHELIAELCPNGVEYMTLGDVAELIRGNGLPKSLFSDSGIGAIHYGQIYTHYGVSARKTISFVSEEAAEKLVKVFPGDVIVTNTSENLKDVCTAVAWIGKETIVTGGHATVIRTSLDPSFLSYWFRTEQFQRLKPKLAIGSKVIDISAKRLAGIKVPVPPLEVQQEIVRILDEFTQLQAELEAELEARRQQYGFYRETLISKREPETYALHALGEIATFEYGLTAKATESGTHRLIRITDISQNGSLNNAGKKYVTPEVKDLKYVVKCGDVLVARTGASFGKSVYFSDPMASVYASFLIRISVDKSLVSSRFLWHFMQTNSYWTQANSLVSNGGQAQFNANAIKQIVMPVPPLEEQERIVNILDKFEALVNDLTSGLPAEIEARRQQYEYYRDQLLDFPELKA